MQSRASCLCLTAAVAVAGCAGPDGLWDDIRGTPQYYTYSNRDLPWELQPAFPRQCIGNDILVVDFTDCDALADAICYQLDNGEWCMQGYTYAEVVELPPETPAEPLK
ncbi:hypothetical protein [Microbulbifer discodermiae]|uniref:hypothetical protein n=1 Tax=Microbulbifer sp. 2201CG32-9 TaxID=3232309 RepID=UPI00345BD34C